MHFGVDISKCFTDINFIQIRNYTNSNLLKIYVYQIRVSEMCTLSVKCALKLKTIHIIFTQKYIEYRQ